MVALSPPTPDSVPSTQEHALLASLIAPPNPAFPTDPLSLSTRFSISLPILLDWLAAPETRTRVAAAVDAQQLLLQNRSHRAKLRALDALERVLDTNPALVEQRRAAAAILRPSFLPRVPPTAALSGRCSSRQTEDDETPIVLEPISHPKPHRSPQDTVLLILARLQDNHNPTGNCGLASLYAHMSESARKERPEYRDYLADAGDDDLLTNFTTALLHAPTLVNLNPAQKHDPTAHFTQPLTLTFNDLSTHTATLHLQQFTARDTEDPIWLLTHIDHEVIEDPIRAEQRKLPADCNKTDPNKSPSSLPTTHASAIPADSSATSVGDSVNTDGSPASAAPQNQTTSTPIAAPANPSPLITDDEAEDPTPDLSQIDSELDLDDEDIEEEDPRHDNTDSNIPNLNTPHTSDPPASCSPPAASNNTTSTSHPLNNSS